MPVAHFAVSLRRSTAGKHVFCEKPLCDRAASTAATLVAEASRRGVRLGCAPDTFLGAGGRPGARDHRRGRIGTVLCRHRFLLSHGMEHWHPNPEFFFKPGGGPILDIGPYYLAALVNLLGPVARVRRRAPPAFAHAHRHRRGPAQRARRITVETPTTVMALLRFASGADIVFTLSWDVWKHSHLPIELYGTDGSLRVPDPNFFGGDGGVHRARWRLGQRSTSSEQPFGDRTGVRRPGPPARRIAPTTASSASPSSPMRWRTARRIAPPARSRAMRSTSCTRCCRPLNRAAASRYNRASSGRPHSTDDDAAACERAWRRLSAGITARQAECRHADNDARAQRSSWRSSPATRRRSTPSTAIAGWAAALGYKGVQIPTWDGRLFDLDKAADSADLLRRDQGRRWPQHGVALTELSTHLQGQLVAVHPAYDEAFDGFAPAAVRGNPTARQAWAVDQLMKAARASQRLGLTAQRTFSGALAWPYLYPWPQRPPGLIETAFDELAKRWKPILDAFDAAGVDLCYEIHPGEDLHRRRDASRCSWRASATTRAATSSTTRATFVLQQLDYLAFIDIYHERIKAFHVKDAEFNPTGRQGVYGGFQSWIDRAGRFRSLGDGQVDFGGIFSKLAQIRLRLAGRCWNGNAASRSPRTARARARRSSPTTSSA